MRGIQRQTFSSRSSIASPLVLSENGTKPTWSHSAKLQLRSNSPSRFSLESHSSSPTLEMIGEVVDGKLSESGLSGSPKPQGSSAGKSSLAVSDSKRLTEQGPPRATAQAEQKAAPPAGGHGAVVPGAEQVGPRHGATAQETDASGGKRSSAKTGLEGERSPKKRPTPSSTSSSSLSPASPAVDKSPSRTQSKGPPTASNPKDRGDGAPKTSRAASSRTATPSKKGSPQTQGGLQLKRGGTPAAQSSHPPRRTSPRGGGERSSASGKTKAADRSTSREPSRVSVPPEKKTGGPTSRPSAGSRAESRTAGRSSSSSSSITSLRSSPANGPPTSRGPRQSSRTEDKGLSFFKSALRSKDSRRSAEEGGGEAARDGGHGGHGATKKAPNAPEAPAHGAAAKDKHSLLPPTKAKLPGAEPPQSSTAKEPSKKEPVKKTMQSRKIPISSTQTGHRAK